MFILEISMIICIYSSSPPPSAAGSAAAAAAPPPGCLLNLDSNCLRLRS